MSDKITIRRAKHDKDNPYFLMRRDTAQDHSISAEALGILTEILSRPDDWRVSPDQLSNRLDTKRARVYRILKELIAARYIERIYHRDSHGRVQWVEYVVHECPLLGTNQQMVKQDVVKQDVEIQHNTYKREVQNTEKTKNTVAPKSRATDSAPADAEYDAWKRDLEAIQPPPPQPRRKLTFADNPDIDRLKEQNGTVIVETPQPTDFDLLVTAVERVLNIRGAGAEVYAKMLTGMNGRGEYKTYRMDDPVSATELQDWALWYERHNPKLNKPTTPMKLQSSILEYRAAKTNEPTRAAIIESAPVVDTSAALTDDDLSAMKARISAFRGGQ